MHDGAGGWQDGGREGRSYLNISSEGEKSMIFIMLETLLCIFEERK